MIVEDCQCLAGVAGGLDEREAGVVVHQPDGQGGLAGGQGEGVGWVAGFKQGGDAGVVVQDGP